MEKMLFIRPKLHFFRCSHSYYPVPFLISYWLYGQERSEPNVAIKIGHWRTAQNVLISKDKCVNPTTLLKRGKINLTIKKCEESFCFCGIKVHLEIYISFKVRKRKETLLLLKVLLDTSCSEYRFKFIYKMSEASAQQRNRVKRQPIKMGENICKPYI